jgi:hypothetical protein
MILAEHLITPSHLVCITTNPPCISSAPPIGVCVASRVLVVTLVTKHLVFTSLIWHAGLFGSAGPWTTG